MAMLLFAVDSSARWNDENQLVQSIPMHFGPGGSAYSFSLRGEMLRLEAIGLRNIERPGVCARAGARSEVVRSAG